jgi:hypothetical protein
MAAPAMQYVRIAGLDRCEQRASEPVGSERKLNFEGQWGEMVELKRLAKAALQFFSFASCFRSSS